MSDFTSIHADLVGRLQGKASLRGVTILSLDDQNYYKALGDALANIHGVVIAVGNPSGQNAGSNVKGGYFDSTIRAYIFENQAINRNRALAATVANQAARLALSGVVAGARVHQTDVNSDFWLITAGQESDAAQWAPLLVATQIFQLVIRSINLWSPDANQTFVCQGFDPGTLDELHDYVMRFALKVGLDPADVT